MQSGWKRDENLAVTFARSKFQRNSREDPDWNDRKFSFSSTFPPDRYRSAHHCNVLTRVCVRSYETGFSYVFSLYLSSTSISLLRVAASLCFCSLFVYLDTLLFFALSFWPPTISHGRGLYPLSPLCEQRGNRIGHSPRGIFLGSSSLCSRGNLHIWVG